MNKTLVKSIIAIAALAVTISFMINRPDLFGFDVSNARGSQKSCPVHKKRLRGDIVPIVSGLPMFKPGYLDARKKGFPCENSIVYGGCLVRPRPTKRATVLFCQECRNNANAWGKTHDWNLEDDDDSAKEN